MCRLMPFWAPVFEEARWSVRALLPIRSPLEVGWSLNCRDGIGSAYGCLLWLRHVLDAEAETRGMARAVLDWPQFLGDGRKALARASEQLGLIWPYWGESALADIDRFVSDDLRHQRASEADLRAHPAVNDLVRETYDAMIDLVRDSGDTCVLRRLDDLRAGFERASAIFDCPMRELNEEVRRTRSRAAAEIARADEEVRRARLQAAAEIAGADAIIARIADRGRGKSCDSKRTGARSFWRPRSKAAAGAKDLEVIRNSLFFEFGVLPRNEPGRSCGGSGRRVPLSGSRRSRGPRSRAVFLDQGLSCPIPRCRGGRPQRALALRNARTPRKQNSDGLVVPSPALRRRVALFMALSAFNLRIGRGDGRNRRGLTRRPIRVRDILVNSVD